MPTETQENTAERSYVAFISYRHKELDREAAVRIQKKIENYVVPKEYRDKVGGKKLGVCFRDEDELPASSSLSDSITYALDHTRFLIVICTPDLPLSKWCMQEITYFLRTHDRDHVLAVLVDGDPEESFPEPLRFSYDDEGRLLAEVEPLAANIAGENHTINNKTFKKEVVRLFAAIIGCPFDALWQRERRARTNRLIAAAGVVFAAMAVFLGVVLSKNAQISEQNSQILEQNAQILEQNDQIKEQMAQISEQNDQISEQKDQISEQNTKLQQQMSSVLVDSGKMQLESYDRKAALSSALEALESDDPAIYDHRAESLLASALGTYANLTSECSKLCDQNTAVTQLAAASEGKLLLTADSFGTIRAYVTETGEQRWEAPLTSSESLRLYPVDEQGLVICKTYQDCVALSLEDGSLAWAFPYQDSTPFQTLSEDGSIFAVMDRGIEKDGVKGSALFFLNTADGSVLQQVDIPCDGFHVRTTSTLDYFYQYAGDFSTDKTRFACAIQVENEDEEKTKNTIFYAVDLTDGSIQRVGSFTQAPDMILSLAYYEPEESVYAAISRGHQLLSVVFPLDRETKEIISTDYDYSLSSRSGFSNYDYMFKELPYLPPLNNEELSIVFSRNVVYLMNLNNGKMRNTINLDSAIVYAEWIDTEEEIFQMFTESGWCLKYDVSHYDNKAIESMYGVGIGVKGVQKAAFIRGGSVTNRADGIIAMTREDVPGQLLLSKTVSDASMKTVLERGSDESNTYMALSPSGKKLMVFSKRDSESIGWEVYDLADKTWSAPAVLPFYVYSGDYPTSILITDDEHLIHDGKIYGLDGTVEDVGIEFPYNTTYHGPSAWLLPDGELLLTCESQADFGGYRLSELSVLSCNLGGTQVEACESVESGIALRNDSAHPHLFATGRNGWIAGWGNLAYLDEKRIQKTYDDPVVAAMDLRTGERIILEECLTDVPVTQLILSNTKPLLLVLYETGDFQLLDLANGGRSILNSAYEYGELKSAAFSDQDSFLVFLTTMDWVDCFDTSTGEMVYSQKDTILREETSTLGTLHAKEDPNSRRMIVWANYSYDFTGSAAILDTDAWVPLATVDNYIDVSEELKTVVIGAQDQVCTCLYYSLQDLKAQAREKLN